MPDISALDKLRPKIRRFVEEYLVDLNGAQAAIRAGYKKKAARVQASKLLTNPNVVEAVQELRDKMSRRCELTIERTLQEIARVAYSSAKRLYGPDGSPIKIGDLDDDTAAAIAGIEMLEQYEGSGEDRVFVGYTKKYKLHSKTEALNMAGRYFKLFTDKTELTDGDGNSYVVAVPVKVTTEEEWLKAVKEHAGVGQ
jgi:phage terminase small subunit